MAAKGSLSFVELHIEKIVLGLAVALAVGVTVYFLTGANTIGYSGEKLGPGALDETIAKRAQDLQDAVKRHKEPAKPVPTFSKALTDQFEGGLFAPDPNGGPALPRTLGVATAFGAPTPPLVDIGEKPEEKVELVKVLSPTTPVARTGISMVRRQQAVIPGPGGKEPAPAKPTAEAPTERSWVTVGAYFPREAQKRDMTSAGYVGYRARVFVLGVDVQRQVLLPNGQFSDWQDVEPGPAMPRVDAPAPVLDERTGDVLNQTTLEQTLEQIKASQKPIMQPEFYPVEAGDAWAPPPLPGLETKAAEEEVVDANKPGNIHAIIKKKLDDAQRAKGKKDWETVERLAQEVLNEPQANAGEKARAERLLADAKRDKPKNPPKPPPPPPGRLEPPVPPPPPPPPPPPDERRPVAPDQDLRTDPSSADRDPAVWFHDDSVDPGKTYRYRMRVKLWNRYVGRRAALRNPDQASQTVLVGDWSLPADPVVVAPKTHFFVLDQKTGEVPSATVAVFTWYSGRWYKQSFDVQVGDTVGDVKEIRTTELDVDGKPRRLPIDFSTGAVVLDLRGDEPVFLRKASREGSFTYNEQKSVRLTYLDPADGHVKERINWLDRSDPLYDKLKKHASD